MDNNLVQFRLFKTVFSTDDSGNLEKVKEALVEANFKLQEFVHEQFFKMQVEQSVFTIDRWMTIGLANGEQGKTAWQSAHEVLLTRKEGDKLAYQANWRILDIDGIYHAFVISNQPFVFNVLVESFENVEVNQYFDLSQNNVVSDEQLKEFLDKYVVQTEIDFNKTFDNSKLGEKLELFLPNFDARVERSAVLVFLAKNYPWKEWDAINEDINKNPEKYRSKIEKYMDVVKKTLKSEIKAEMFNFIPSAS